MGIVIGAIQSLKQPATVAQLDALFQTKPDEEDLHSAQSELPEGQQFLEVETKLDTNTPFNTGESFPNVDLSQVKDNTYFRPKRTKPGLRFSKDCATKTLNRFVPILWVT